MLCRRRGNRDIDGDGWDVPRFPGAILHRKAYWVISQNGVGPDNH
jgi:hypothetical protein